MVGLESYCTVVQILRDHMCRALGLFLTHKQCFVETEQRSSVEPEQISAVETGQMSTVETFLSQQRELDPEGCEGSAARWVQEGALGSSP